MLHLLASNTLILGHGIYWCLAHHTAPWKYYFKSWKRNIEAFHCSYCSILNLRLYRIIGKQAWSWHNGKSITGNNEYLSSWLICIFPLKSYKCLLGPSHSIVGRKFTRSSLLCKPAVSGKPWLTQTNVLSNVIL